jgi:hypothetical protein
VDPQDSQPAVQIRFLPGDVEGIVEEVKASELILTQPIVSVKKQSFGEVRKLQMKNASNRRTGGVTIKDDVVEIDGSKATVIHLCLSFKGPAFRNQLGPVHLQNQDQNKIPV